MRANGNRLEHDDGRLVAEEPDECRECNGNTVVQCSSAGSVDLALEVARNRIAELIEERDEARQLVIEANNSLYGSQGYFHSLNGGPFDKYHLSRGIEDLKARLRALPQTAPIRWSAAIHGIRPCDEEANRFDVFCRICGDGPCTRDASSVSRPQSGGGK